MGVPHGRGDGPLTLAEHQRTGTCSPRAWGWTGAPAADRAPEGVFPTGVGMDRRFTQISSSRRSVPHGRGDGPQETTALQESLACSPRAWDGPGWVGLPIYDWVCSPRAWGWTNSNGVRPARDFVFPTGVGMDRRGLALWMRRMSVPHGRGDGPPGDVSRYGRNACSPRAWGWTVGVQMGHAGSGVFPTGVGMDRPSRSARGHGRGVPHGRGDGPPSPRPDPTAPQCSPRAWGWTAFMARPWEELVVFPTGVGMDRSLAFRAVCSGRVPHGRGDGPRCKSPSFAEKACSPRAWGWTGHCEECKPA